MCDIAIDYHNNNNVLSLNGNVFKESEKFRKTLHTLVYEYNQNLEKTFTIMFTNIPGGSATDAYVFEGYLINIKKEQPDIKFIAKCFGEIKSCATILICSPVFDKVYIDRNSLWQIHNMKISLTVDISVTIADLERMIRRLKKHEDKMISYYTERAFLHNIFLPRIEWQKIIDDGDEADLITAQEFFGLGLCDGII